MLFSCELAGYVHRLSWTPSPQKPVEAKSPNQTLVSYTLAGSAKLSRLSSKSLNSRLCTRSNRQLPRRVLISWLKATWLICPRKGHFQPTSCFVHRVEVCDPVFERELLSPIDPYSKVQFFSVEQVLISHGHYISSVLKCTYVRWGP
jgi:hypothetical protein